MALEFQLLNSQHERDTFACGFDPLDRYIRQQARLDFERRVSVVYILVDSEKPSEIIGYYTLSAHSVELAELSEVMKKKLPRYNRVPCILIGRLARDLRFSGTGKLLLLDALKRAFDISKDIGSLAVICKAANDRARDFYTYFGFFPIGKDPSVLFIPMGTIAMLMESS